MSVHYIKRWWLTLPYLCILSILALLDYIWSLYREIVFQIVFAFTKILCYECTISNSWKPMQNRQYIAFQILEYIITGFYHYDGQRKVPSEAIILYNNIATDNNNKKMLSGSGISLNIRPILLKFACKIVLFSKMFIPIPTIICFSILSNYHIKDTIRVAQWCSV